MRSHGWLVLIALTACGPASNDDGPDLVEQISTCEALICQGLSDTETTLCVLEHIQAGEPGYINFAQCQAAGPIGTVHMLIHDSERVSYVEVYHNSDDYDDEPADKVVGNYEVSIDPITVMERFEFCDSIAPSPCAPCANVVDLGPASATAFLCE